MGNSMSTVSAMLARIKHYVGGFSNGIEGSRKRKSSEEEPDQAHTSFSKYRRVKDDFPKYIAAPLNNENHRHPLLQKKIKPKRCKAGTTMGSHNNLENKMESSYFGNMNSKNRIEFADVEFSDDEDDLVWVNQRPTPVNSNPFGPIKRPPVPQLTKIKTTPVPSLYPIDCLRSFGNCFVNGFGGGGSPTDKFKKPMDICNTKALNTPQSFSNNLYVKPMPAPNFYNKTSPKYNSIVADNYNIAERQHYQSLLQQLVPALYCVDQPTDNQKKCTTLLLDDCTFNASSSTKYNHKSVPVIDLSKDGSGRRRSYTSTDYSKIDDDVVEVIEIPDVEPVNTLRDKLQSSSQYRDDIVTNVTKRYRESLSLRHNQILQEQSTLKELTKTTKDHETTIERKLGDFMIKFDTIVLDEEEDEEEIDEYPELTAEHRAIIKRSLYGGSRGDVLINKFNISITRNDIATLVGDNWLNDEVINFYMNLLMERSESRGGGGECGDLPKVYAMNTFFIPKLLSNGHSGLKRWTRKIDIFAYDVIPVPVHVGKVHWCMAIIHLKNKSIKYYDSMGTPNNHVLNALEQYLIDECMDKKKERFNTKDFVKENVMDCPKQMNGSDCGVFSCMFAEYVSRNRDVTFGQPQMQYFRQKMIFEIVQGKLLL